MSSTYFRRVSIINISVVEYETDEDYNEVTIMNNKLKFFLLSCELFPLIEIELVTSERDIEKVYCEAFLLVKLIITKQSVMYVMKIARFFQLLKNMHTKKNSTKTST